MNAPSLGALDEAESALGARAAIVGTYADWAHAPDFPSEQAERDQRARCRPADLLGAVGLVAGRLRPAGVRARPDRRRRPRRADRPLGGPGGRVPATGDAAPRPGDERRLAALVDRGQRESPGRVRRRLAARARAVPARGRRQRGLGLESDRVLRRLDTAARTLPRRRARSTGWRSTASTGARPATGVGRATPTSSPPPCASSARSRPAAP